MIDVVWIFIIACTSICVWLLKQFLTSGFISDIKVAVVEEPKRFAKSVTVYYKHRLGAYSGTGSVVSEIKDILPSTAIPFGIFYDNPDETPDNLLQSAIGVIFAVEEENLFTENYSEQLTQWGYEKMVLPKCGRAVQAVQPRRNFFSLFALLFRTYGIVKNYIQTHRLETSVSIEVYDKDEYVLLFPLDNATDFIVSEYKTREQLESDLAKKRFDSDESDSESEPEGSAAEEDEEVAAGNVE